MLGGGVGHGEKEAERIFHPCSEPSVGAPMRPPFFFYFVQRFGRATLSKQLGMHEADHG